MYNYDHNKRIGYNVFARAIRKPSALGMVALGMIVAAFTAGVNWSYSGWHCLVGISILSGLWLWLTIYLHSRPHGNYDRCSARYHSDFRLTKRGGYRG
jgi:hypothetical protein